MAITTTLFLAVAVHGRSCTIRLGGVLDGATAHRLADLGRTVAVAEACYVTIDLTEVDLVDVAGWHALRSLTADLTERGVIVTQLGSRASYDRLDGVLVGLDACRRHPDRLTCSAARPPRGDHPADGRGTFAVHGRSHGRTHHGAGTPAEGHE